MFGEQRIGSKEMKTRNNHHPGMTALVAALATFTVLVWVGVIARVVISRSTSETGIAHAPATPQSQPIRAVQADLHPRARESAPAPDAPRTPMTPGGIFPGDVPSVKR